MISVLKNNLARLASRKAVTGIALLLTAASMLLAVYFTPRQLPQARIALVTSSQAALPSSPYLQCTRVAGMPPRAELLLNKYDAFVVDQGNGQYTIETFKNSAFKQMLRAALRHTALPAAASKQARRGVGTNIIGCMTMFILLQGILLMDLYAEDKEQKQIERIAASPVSFPGYLLAHCLFTFSWLFIPVYLTLMVVKLLLHWEIGFTLPQYLLPLAVVCALATAFTLLINSLAAKGDTANMVGSAIVVLSSLLAGCFYPITKGSRIVQAGGLLPQKALLSFVQGWENGVRLPRIIPQLSYVIILTLLMFGFSLIKNLRDYIRRGD